MNTSTPKIALIGCGAIAEEYYLPALAASPAILRNLILVDRDESQLAKISAKYKVGKMTRDHREVLEEADGAIIALPTGLHAPIGTEFLSRSIPVLCEKPLAENADIARRMVEAADRHETTLAANYLQRRIPHFARIKELLDGQVYGKPLTMDYVIGEIFNWPTVSGFYFTSDPATRGILRDRGAHAADHICWWLGGKPEVVRSENDSFGGSEATARVRFERGTCAGTLSMNWFADVPCRVVIHCEGGNIECNIYDYQRLVITKNGKAGELNLDSPIETKLDVAEEIVNNFIGVIERGDRPLISGADVLDSVEFVDECYRKAERFDMPWYRFAEVRNVC